MIIHWLRLSENGTAYINIGLHLQQYAVTFKQEIWRNVRKQAAFCSKLLPWVSDNRACLYPYVCITFRVTAAPSMMAVTVHSCLWFLLIYQILSAFLQSIYENVSILPKVWPGLFISMANTNISIAPVLWHFEDCKVDYLVNSLSVIEKNKMAGHVARMG